MLSITIDPRSYPVSNVLDILLLDRTTKKNIIFATDSYAEKGELYAARSQISRQLLEAGSECIIQPRVLKALEEQQSRTRKRAEVFTPAWVCCMMNNHIDEVWFGVTGIFGNLDDQKWTPSESPIQMPERKRWQAYVDSRRLEITCGEAPYLVSRYDMASGQVIPVRERTGLLDRKLRIVGENVASENEWIKWTLRAFQSVYGYEYQGDNLLIARINMLFTFVEYTQEYLNRQPTNKELKEVARVISWNLWQMDGLTGIVPMGALGAEYHQIDLTEFYEMDSSFDEISNKNAKYSRIYDWRGMNQSLEYNAFKEGRNKSMKFDFLIGNPPYQDETLGDNKGFAPPIYDKFMDAAYEVAEKVELIHPARFLFNAGSTPKAWNQKMLSDKHFKILHYEEDASRLFSNTEIKGGVVVSYRDSENVFGAIGIFTPQVEMQEILRKVSVDAGTVADIGVTSYAYHFTELMHKEHPEARILLSKGHDYDLKSNVLDKLPLVFLKNNPLDGEDYIKIMGRSNNERVIRYVKRKYINNVSNLDSYKIFLPKASGIGSFGESLAPSIIAEPGVGYTETFFGIGAFDNQKEAKWLDKYLKTKLARALLSVCKKTQMITPSAFKYVPLQDFTDSSDIDWSRSITEIDQQLYAKYGLSQEEIDFIETHVKEME